MILGTEHQFCARQLHLTCTIILGMDPLLFFHPSEEIDAQGYVPRVTKPVMAEL